MERNTQRIGLVNLILLAVLGGGGAILGRYVHSLSAQVGAAFFGLGFLVAAISYFQMRLEEAERLEKLEFDELSKARGSSSLFQAADSEVFPAQRSREQFERFFVPAFTVVLFLLQAGAAFWGWRWLTKSIPVPLTDPTLGMALFGLLALVLFLLGKFSAGLARFEGNRLLRPGASYLLLNAYICFLVAAGIAVMHMGAPAQTDRYIAWALTALLALAAIENLVNLILEIYRPRIKGKAARFLYDSRLIGLLGQPEGLVTTAAQALDYQFGFKVSETWFYQFLEKAFGWLILFQLGLLFLSTSFLFIAPGEEALVERFGRLVALDKPLGPGLHLKWPWPVERAHRYRTDRIQSFNIGFVANEEAAQKEKTVLWTVSHYKEEFNLLVASPQRRLATTNVPSQDQGVPVDLLTVGIPIQYQIENVHAWATNNVDPGQLLERIATREAIRYLVGVDLFDIMSRGRAQAAQQLKQRIQKEADLRQLGVKIVFVGVQDMHPPVKVAPAFELKMATEQENEAKLRAAESYALTNLSLAEATAFRVVREAEAYATSRVASAQAQAAQFTNQLVALNASPPVYMNRAYLDMLQRGLTNVRKYVIAVTNANQVFQLNLEDKIREDLLNLPVPGPRR